jgi:hypothetical protein
MLAAIIEARDLVKRFDGFTAVDRISFAVPEGVIFGFLGPNGAHCGHWALTSVPLTHWLFGIVYRCEIPHITHMTPPISGPARETCKPEMQGSDRTVCARRYRRL